MSLCTRSLLVLAVICSYNGSVSSWHQSIKQWGTNFLGITVSIEIFSFKKIIFLIIFANGFLAHWGDMVNTDSDNGNDACLTPRQYLNQCVLIVNWNNIQWNFNLADQLWQAISVLSCPCLCFQQVCWTNLYHFVHTHLSETCFVIVDMYIIYR